MNFNYIKLCPLCRKEDSSDEFGTILIGITNQKYAGSRYRDFEVRQTINCCKECVERLSKKIADEISNIILDSSPVLKEYSKEK